MNQDVVNWPYILTDVWFKRSRACSIASIKTWNPFQTFLFLVSNFQSAKSMMLKTDDADSYIFIWYWNMSQMPLLFDPLIHTKKTFLFFSVDQKVTVENNIKLLKSLDMSQWPFLLFLKKKGLAQPLIGFLDSAFWVVIKQIYAKRIVSSIVIFLK